MNLQAKYPHMFAQDAQVEYIGVHWLHIVDQLLQEIAEYENRLLKKHGQIYFGTIYHPVLIEQIKQKLGRLCIYYTGGDNYIVGLVTMAQRWAYQHCYICGDLAKARSHQGWTHTVCEYHFEELKND